MSDNRFMAWAYKPKLEVAVSFNLTEKSLRKAS